MGNNRDYKTTARKAATNLALHADRMKELMAEGETADNASRMAYEELKAGKLKTHKEERGSPPVKCACGNDIYPKLGLYDKTCAVCRLMRNFEGTDRTTYENHQRA